jgi:hypothetical protein
MSLRFWLLIPLFTTVACEPAKTTGDDDDDDDDDGTPTDVSTGPHSSTTTPHSFFTETDESAHTGRGSTLVEFEYMTVYGQFDVAGGQVVAGPDSFLELAIGPASWDFNDVNDTNYCLIQADFVTNTLGILDAQDVIPPTADVGDGSTAVTDCASVFNVDPRIDVALVVGAIPEWGLGIASELSPGMDPSSLPAPYDVGAVGAYWNVPIIKPAVYETVLAFSVDTTGGILPATDTHGRTVLPRGSYFSIGPIINISGLFTY